MKQPLADLHVHTTASGHAYSTVTEIVGTAAERGLELIAICDHGPDCPGGAHEYHFWNLKALPSILSGVRILKGVEADIVESDNGLDLPDEMLELLDFVAVGFHPECGFDGGDTVRNTEAMLRAMANPNVDMVTHPGNGRYPVDRDRIVAAALEHDVIVELNNFTFAGNGSRRAWVDLERDFAADVAAAGARTALNSDAHFHLHVGQVSEAMRVAEEVGFREEQVVNRTAATVLEYLLTRRERPRLDMGGEW